MVSKEFTVSFPKKKSNKRWFRWSLKWFLLQWTRTEMDLTILDHGIQVSKLKVLLYEITWLSYRSFVVCLKNFRLEAGCTCTGQWSHSQILIPFTFILFSIRLGYVGGCRKCEISKENHVVKCLSLCWFVLKIIS